MEKTKKCRFCQTEIPKKARVCPNCNRTLKSHGCLVTILVMVAIFVALGVAVSQGVDDVEKHPEKYDDSIAAKYIEIDTEKGKNIDKILKECGISEVKSFEHDASMDNASFEGEKIYRLETKEAKNIVLYLNGDMDVYTIRYSDHDLYKDGAKVAALQDYILTSKEATNLMIECEEKVKETLKSPSTAKFPNITEWGFKKEKNILTVQGYVDAQNSFGAELRSKFQFIIDSDTNTITSYIFDGQEMIAQ